MYDSDAAKSPRGFERIQELFEVAYLLEPEARRRFLDRECGDDSEIREEVASLFEAHDASRDLEPMDHGLARRLLHERGKRDLIGVQVGCYVVEGLIGSGGTSAVYGARRVDGRFELDVALKVLKRGMDTDELLRRFHREQQALARLDHTNIARLLDAGSLPDGRPYFVMERIEGVPITEYCDRGRVSLRERLVLFRKVCAGVQFAHQQLVVHRDLKPSNILVTADGVPKLLDFGIAKFLSPDSPFLTTQGSSGGRHPMTLAYASPEQLSGEAITTATDIYALGVLLHELLTGRRPFASFVPGSREHQHAVRFSDPVRPSRGLDQGSFEDPPASVQGPDFLEELGSRERTTKMRSLRRLLRGDLDNILLTALRNDVRSRYASVEQFSLDLQRHLCGHPVLARPGTFGYRTQKFLRRNRAGVAVATLFCLLLVGGTIASFAGFRRAQKQRDETFRAQVQRRESLNLVEEMLVALNYGHLPRDISLDQILRAAVDKLRHERLSDDDLTVALMETTIGKLCLRNGLHVEGDELLERSLQTRERLSGAASTEVAESCFIFAVSLRRRGEFLEALSYAERSVGNYRGAGEENRVYLGIALAEQGTILNLLGEAGRAEPLLEEALAIAQEFDGTCEGYDAVNALNSLALVKLGLGKTDQGENLLREAFEISDDGNPQFGVLLNNMAKIRFREGKFEEAGKLVNRALDLQLELLPLPHADVAMSLNNLGLIAFRQDKLERAEEALREAAEMRRTLYGASHEAVADVLTNLGQVLARRGRIEEAERAGRNALKIYRQTLPRRHPKADKVRNLLVQLEEGQAVGNVTTSLRD